MKCGSLEKLPEFIFQELKNLKELNLIDCRYLKLNKNHFHGLESLEIFYFGGKFIEEIDTMINLKKLLLNRVKINQFWLKGFENIESLSLYDIDLNKNISKDLFKNFKNLNEFSFTDFSCLSQENLKAIKHILDNIRAKKSSLEFKHDHDPELNLFSDLIPCFKDITSLKIQIGSIIIIVYLGT